jgi:broad specificity phosphatase PhoE
MELLLVRHAQPLRIDASAGPADPPLHHKGIAQSQALAAALAGARLDALYCSPMRRARETADAVAAATGLTPRISDSVAEFDRTAASYIPLEDLRAERDPRLARWAAGDIDDLLEDPVTFQATVTVSINAIVAAHAGQTVAVVCHGGVINAYVAGLLSSVNVTWAHHDYTGITRLAISRQGTRTVRAMNDCAHLTGTALLPPAVSDAVRR